MRGMKVAALQMVSGPDVAANLATARRLLEDAAAQGARLAALPEYFCLMGQHDRDKLAVAEAAATTAGTAIGVDGTRGTIHHPMETLWEEAPAAVVAAPAAAGASF